MTTEQIALPASAIRASARVRYFQFALLVLAGGAIYPLLYLRQNFETTILSTFGIDSAQLGVFYSTLGVVYAVTYLPSGWLADRFSPRLLITFSLAMVGGLGLWFSTVPPSWALEWIFIGWGLAAGLTFWASLLKGVKLLATANEQGRFFGILDGGRGLVEAILASLALGIFAYVLEQGHTSRQALQQVIYLYSFSCLLIALLIYLFLERGKAEQEVKVERTRGQLWRDIKTLLAIPRVWLLALIMFCGYQLFWATYSFSAYLQHGYGLTALGAGFITVTKLWMRPIGGIGAGFLGDRFSKEAVLAISMALASLGLLCLTVFPHLNSVYFLLGLVLLIGVLTYAIRGLYWSLLDACNVPLPIVGLAIGFISVLGYLPDIFLPMINAAIASRFPQGVLSYQLYFAYIAVCGLLGAGVTCYFKLSVKPQEKKA
ncbi:MFS transporter [Neisseriaceae bacterium TC5R-5]|nr:MFS transporter [Neisseriaceae bacterium TC5R-5]